MYLRRVDPEPPQSVDAAGEHLEVGGVLFPNVSDGGGCDEANRLVDREVQRREGVLLGLESRSNGNRADG